jgi:hypothetical protein
MNKPTARVGLDRPVLAVPKYSSAPRINLDPARYGFFTIIVNQGELNG